MIKNSRQRRKVYFRIIIVVIVFIILFLINNTCYQVSKKPTEILSYFSEKSAKPYLQTWGDYKDIFIENEVQYINRIFLATLVQLESGGHPWISTEWVFDPGRGVSKLYAPSSTSVGLLQFTRETFEQASGYCVHNGHIARVGKWYEWESCWFNGLNTRLSSANSVESGAAILFVQTEGLLKGVKIANISDKQKQELAAIIHLCGPGKGQIFIKKKFKVRKIGSCYKHSPVDYLKQFALIYKIFEGINAQEGPGSSTSASPD